MEAKEKKKKLTLSVAHLLERRFVTERVFARLYDEGKTRSDRLDRLCRFLLLSGGHRVAFFFWWSQRGELAGLSNVKDQFRVWASVCSVQAFPRPGHPNPNNCGWNIQFNTRQRAPLTKGGVKGYCSGDDLSPSHGEFYPLHGTRKLA